MGADRAGRSCECHSPALLAPSRIRASHRGPHLPFQVVEVSSLDVEIQYATDELGIVSCFYPNTGQAIDCGKWYPPGMLTPENLPPVERLIPTEQQENGTHPNPSDSRP